MQIIDLFSGIGGFSMAGKRMGWDTVQFVERDRFCQRVLRHHFPDAAIHDDIKTFTLETLKKSRWNPAANTIVCGGFPCQPVSTAGKRKGDDDDRWLWPEMLRVIAEIRPLYVLAENVRGLINWGKGVLFEQVLCDLEAQGYETAPFLLPAAAIGAPHLRERVFVIAHASSQRLQEHKSGTLSNENRNNTFPSQEQKQQQGGIRTIGENEVTSYADIKQSAKWDDNRIQKDSPHDRTEIGNRLERSRNFKAAADPDGERFRGKGYGENKSKFIGENDEEADIANARYFTGTNWNQFPTQSPVCERNDGFSRELSGITFSKWRQESLKALGNAVVPGLVYEIFKAINQHEK